MSLDETIAATVEVAVSRALEPLRREVAALRRERDPAAPVTVTEAARRLGVSTKTVRRKVQAGVLRSVDVGGTIRVLLDGLGPS